MKPHSTSFLTRVSSTLAAALILASSAHAETVSIESLLNEMVDRSTIARMPAPAYTCLQASSYNRAQIAPDQPGWFANQDWSHFIRSEERNGETEWVMMDADGPGAVVRIWMPPSVRDGTIVGTVRVYLDHAEEPTLEMTGEELLNGGLTGPPLSAVRAIGRNLYLPIPYAQHCKITYDRNWWTDGQQPHDRAFYLINYRSYEAGTEVETFSAARLAAAGPTIDNIQQVLLQPENVVPADSSPVDPAFQTLQPGEQLTLNLPDGPRAVGRLALRLEAQNMASALRSTVVAISIDGEPAVWCPAGDFFGTGPGLHPWRGWYQTVAADGVMTCYWVMPYQQSAVIDVINHGAQDVTATLQDVVTSPWTWDDRSLVFHSNYRQVGNIPSEPKSDFNYIEITGQGMYVGDTLSIHHNANGWWGEGDERIYVDGEAFPSHAGTGAEDYYGFAHGGAGSAFSAPFHAVPLFTGHRGPGLAVSNRTRALDAIPFMTSLKMDMEVSTTFGGVVPITHAAATHWYAKTGATHNRPPDTSALWVPGQVNDGTTITLTANDDVGASSFNAAGKWSVAAAPNNLNNYQINVSGRFMRTPSESTSNHTFAGNSLTLSNGGMVASKAGSDTAVLTMNNLIANNGVLANSRTAGGATIFAGNINNQAGGLTLEATHGAIILQSTISGVGNLGWNSTDASFTNQLTGVNTYTGNTTIGNDTTVEFTSTNQQLFNIQNENFSNSITGTGTAKAIFNGVFNLSTSSVTDATGVWKLVDVDALTATWGDTFGLKLNGTTDFTTTDNVIFTATRRTQGWSFDTRTGSLTLSIVEDDNYEFVADPAADWASSNGTAASVVGGTSLGWSYWRADSLGGSRTALVPSGNTGDVGGAGFAGANVAAPTRALPAVQGDNQNGGDYELFSDGQINNAVVGTDLLIHPDFATDSGFIFVTYTFAAADLQNGSQATIEGSFRNLIAAGNGVNVYVLHNTTTLWSATPDGTNTLSQAAGTFDIGNLTVAAGDTISFVVDWKGDRGGDETALRASISVIAEPGEGSYESWAAANNVTGGPNGDSDNDGVPNLIKYALADGGERGELSGGTITFTKRGAPYGGDISLIIETSETLEADSWTVAVAHAPGDPNPTISYTFSPGNPAKKFARLRVAISP